ncbi:hypothetical protein AFE_2968 [Acidithiobacillus ferrooxidans ATCC 23270]|nr:hypothetical protein AFE_2968 [Acidithiobacillus ferrooxidans ATCC 23270]
MGRTLGVGTVTPNLIGAHRDLIQRYGGHYPVISAHIWFDGTGLDPRYQYVTVLRDPVDRFISWLYFIDKDVELTEDTRELKVGAQLFLRSEGEETNQTFMRSASNPYVNNFSSVVMRCNASWQQKMVAALSVLTDYDLVGFQADLPQFIEQLAKLLHVINYVSLRPVNVTSSRPQRDGISEKMLHAIRKLTEWDLELYSEIQRMANRQAPTIGVSCNIQPFNREFGDWGFKARKSSNVYWLGSYLTHYLAKDLSTRNGSVAGRALVSNGAKGYLCHGPYLDLDPGHYCAVANGVWITRGVTCNADVCSGKGAVLHAEETLVDLGAKGTEWSLPVDFALDEETTSVEFRLMVPDEHQVQLNTVTIVNEKMVMTILGLEPDSHAANRGVEKQNSGSTLIFPVQMSSKIGLRVGTTLQTTGQEGFLCYGPYMTLSRGIYRVNLMGSIGPQGLAGAYADIVCDAGKKGIHNEPLAITPFNEYVDSTVGKPWMFFLEQDVSDLEIRLWVSNQTEINLCGIVLQQIEET